MIAALFVETDGAYFGLDGVDPWDEARDARKYDGPYPVVAHPPCSTWCRLAPVNEARYGHRVGEDGGCFESALANVRRCGGVLEHPAESIAWSRFKLRSRHGASASAGPVTASPTTGPRGSTRPRVARLGHEARVPFPPRAAGWRAVRCPLPADADRALENAPS